MTGEAELKRDVGASEGSAVRFQIHIARGLAIGFGGLVLIAVVSVFALGLWSARQNTFDLLADKSESTMRVVLARVEQYLQPAEDMLVLLGRELETGGIDHTDDAILGARLAGALSATPQVRSAVFIHDDWHMVFALRGPDGVALQIVDVSEMRVIVEAVEAAKIKDQRVLGGHHSTGNRGRDPP